MKHRPIRHLPYGAVFFGSFSGNKPSPEVVERKALAVRPPCVKGAVALATEGLIGARKFNFYNPSVLLRKPPPFTQGRRFVAGYPAAGRFVQLIIIQYILRCCWCYALEGLPHTTSLAGGYDFHRKLLFFIYCPR